MKIELKNIQCFEALSHETNAFSGSLYIDGVRVAIAENNGSGGETSYLPLDVRYRDTIRQAEDYCKNNLPKLQSSFTDDNGKPMEYDRTLSLYIDELVEEHLKEKFLLKLKRLEKTQIIFGDLDAGSVWCIRYEEPIADILSRPNGVPYLAKQIITNVLPDFKEGMKILNTNLPESVFIKAGLLEHQYLPAEKQPEAKHNKPKAGNKRNPPKRKL